MTQVLSRSVSEEEVARFSALADEWWNPRGAFRALHDLQPLRIAYIDQYAGGLKGKKVLDVGCGGGLLAEVLAARGAQVTGIDASDRAVQVAQTHARSSGLTIDYRLATAEKLAATGAQFDVITAFEIVEHVADLGAFMAAVVHMLKPGGVLLLATMNRTKRSFLLGVVLAEYVLGWVPPGTHDWDRFVRPSEIAGLWQAANVQPVDITGLVYHPLRRSFVFSKGNTAVNYFMAGKKSKQAG